MHLTKPTQAIGTLRVCVPVGMISQEESLYLLAARPLRSKTGYGRMAHARSHAPRHRVAPVPGRGTARSTAGCTNSTAAEVERCLPKAAGNCNSNSKAAHAVPRPILINPITCPSRCLPRSQTSSSIQRSCSSLAGQSCEGYDTRGLCAASFRGAMNSARRSYCTQVASRVCLSLATSPP